MIPEEKDRSVKLAACSALFYGLGFVKRHFGNQAKRDHIMNVVLDCCGFDDEKVRIAAYEILVRIAARYYEFLPDYMVRVFNVSTAMRCFSSFVLNAFWITNVFLNAVDVKHHQDRQRRGRTTSR